MLKVIFPMLLTGTLRDVEKASFSAFWRQVELEISCLEIPEIVKRTIVDINIFSEGTGVGFDVATVGIVEGAVDGALVGLLEGRSVVGAVVGAAVG